MPAHRPHRRTTTTLLVTLTLAVTALTSCSDDDTPTSVASKAASAFESATAEAGRRFDEIKGGIDAKGSVQLGDITTDSDGRASVDVTVENTTDSTKSFAVQINFKDEDDNLLDASVVTVSDVAANQSGKGTARSTRDLSGNVRAEVERAVRY
ncbi:FxLYD domain-containing protein [Streptomyces chartreusis]